MESGNLYLATVTRVLFWCFVLWCSYQFLRPSRLLSLQRSLLKTWETAQCVSGSNLQQTGQKSSFRPEGSPGEIAWNIRDRGQKKGKMGRMWWRFGMDEMGEKRKIETRKKSWWMDGLLARGNEANCTYCRGRGKAQRHEECVKAPKRR